MKQAVDEQQRALKWIILADLCTFLKVNKVDEEQLALNGQF